MQPGTQGFFAASDYVQLLEVPARVDRADGDVHPAGNPHIQTGPAQIRAVAVALGERLGDVDPAKAAAYLDRTARFLARWDEATARWRIQSAPLRNVGVAVHHKEWIYLLNFIGVREVIALEPKPGIPPSASHLATVATEVPRQRARMVIHAAYQNPRAAEFIATRTGIPTVELPFTVGGNERAKDLFSLMDDTLARLLSRAESDSRKVLRRASTLPAAP